MTEKGRLYQIICNHFFENENISYEDLTNKILKAFPQITKKAIELDYGDFIDYANQYSVSVSRSFNTPSDRQAWIDSHFVEVIE